MKLTVTKSKNSACFYVQKSIRKPNGKGTTTITIEKLGNLDEVRTKAGGQDPYKWAQEYVNELNRREYEERKSKAEEFKKYVEEAVEEYSDKEADYSSFPWPYEESITIKRADDKIVSYEASAVSYMGGAHGGIALTSHNFNAQTGEEYQLTDMIKNTDELIDYTVSKLEEEHENDEFFPEWKETVEKDILNTNEYPGGFTWTMGDGYLEFSFGQYEIAPYAAGIITVKIDTEQNDFLISEI